MSEPKRRTPRQTLFTVKDRSVITKACLHEGSWEGTRHGYRAHLMYDKHAPEGQKIVWGVAISRRWYQGTAAMVSEGMERIEITVTNRPMVARELKKALLQEQERENADAD